MIRNTTFLSHKHIKLVTFCRFEIRNWNFIKSPNQIDARKEVKLNKKNSRKKRTFAKIIQRNQRIFSYKKKKLPSNKNEKIVKMFLSKEHFLIKKKKLKRKIRKMIVARVRASRRENENCLKPSSSSRFYIFSSFSFFFWKLHKVTLIAVFRLVLVIVCAYNYVFVCSCDRYFLLFSYAYVSMKIKKKTVRNKMNVFHPKWKFIFSLFLLFFVAIYVSCGQENMNQRKAHKRQLKLEQNCMTYADHKGYWV